MTVAQRAALLRLLDGHTPHDSHESRDLAQIRDFAASSPAPFHRRTWPGHLTGSAFILAGNELLLTHHRKLGIWVQLGGHSEGECAAHEVAMREACEESGLEDLRFHATLMTPDGMPRLLDVDAHDIPARGDEPRHQHLDLRFLLQTGQPERVRADPAETRALEWVTLVEAARRGDPGMQRALVKIQAILSATTTQGCGI